MRKFIHAVMLASAAAVGATGCSNFLSSNDVTKDPNQPSSATAAQLFQGIQASQWTEQEALLAITSCVLIQQCSGRGSGRFLDSYTQYIFSAQDFSFDFGQMYLGGGLIDIRSVEAAEGAAGNLGFRGVARIYEALVMSTAAGIWGDIPWSQAGNPDANPTPSLDRQFDIYTGLLTLLDDAITDLAAPITATNGGPGAVDLVFARFDPNNTAWPGQWTRVAHTLKARINMHMAEVNGAAAYNAAIAEALLGVNNINESFRAQHSTTANEGNQWWQFNVTAFGRDLTAGAPLVNLMNNRDGVANNADPRLPQYFGCFTTSPCTYVGNTYDVNLVTGSFIEGTRNVASFNQGIVTWEENQLILAEAYVATGAAATAKPYVDALRASYGFPALAAAPTAAQVFEEQYIAMFQNIEAWSDYKRTCFPALVPANGTFGPPTQIPGRLYYGDSEVNANSSNYPTTAGELTYGGSFVSGQTIVGFRNPDDPNPCP
jgi:starch-binding outer membrane protein, SusD/RagB family